MFKFDDKIAAELSEETAMVAAEKGASLEDFANDGTFVPPVDDDDEADEGNTETNSDSSGKALEDFDEEGAEQEEEYDFNSGAELAANFIAIGQKSLSVKIIKSRRKSVFSDEEIVRILKIKDADTDQLAEKDIALLARWQAIEELIEDSDMPDDIRACHVTVLEHLMKSNNVKIDPVTIAAFQIALYYVMKAIAIYGIKPAKKQIEAA